MSFTSAVFKGLFWTRVADVAFTPDTPKYQAKCLIRQEEHRRKVMEEKARILAARDSRGFRPRSLPVVRVEKVLAATRAERMEAVRAYEAGIPRV